jgi:site-specific recombinase XerD
MPEFEQRLVQQLTVEATSDESRPGIESLAIRLVEIRHLRYHDLRHTFATRLVRGGRGLLRKKWTSIRFNRTHFGAVS